MNWRRAFLNKYSDRFVFKHLDPRWHAAYKQLRHGTYDSERLALYRRAALWLSLNQISGSVCEFGSAGGESFLNLYFQFSRRGTETPHFYLFDSFQGLPAPDKRTPHAGWSEGQFQYSQEAFVKRVDFFDIPRATYTLIPGFYDQTLTPDHQGTLGNSPIALVHIDCDLFESTRLALEFISDKLQEGTLLLFDDYFCSKGRPDMGESGAFQEWLKKHPLWQATPWHTYSIHGHSFILTHRP